MHMSESAAHPDKVRRAAAMTRENAPKRHAVLARRWPFGWVYYVVEVGGPPWVALRQWRQDYEAGQAMMRRTGQGGAR